jgi:hypothetical protein
MYFAAVCSYHRQLRNNPQGEYFLITKHFPEDSHSHRLHLTERTMKWQVQSVTCKLKYVSLLRPKNEALSYPAQTSSVRLKTLQMQCFRL